MRPARSRPARPFSWWLPFGPTDPGEWETRPGSPIAPPYPDIAIASGRRAAAYLRRIKRLSGGETPLPFFSEGPAHGTGRGRPHLGARTRQVAGPQRARDANLAAPLLRKQAC
ncbi:ELM1/GtrOC1 family putative glycosyltransferase [Roseibium salinum]|nr:ELM1/GtrOC1 family putative glycosyltransferase [Roseibium salinum]